MQSIIERQLGAQPSAFATSRPSRVLALVVGVGIILASVYITVFMLPGFTDQELDKTLAQHNHAHGSSNGVDDAASKHGNGKKANHHAPHGKPHGPHGGGRHRQHADAAHPHATKPPTAPHGSDDHHAAASASTAGSGASPDAAAIQPWGYNKNRNVPRWAAIQASIDADFAAANQQEQNGGAASLPPFVLVDYGSDQGFFAINAARRYKQRNIFVLSVEMGGVGGEIWKKKATDGDDVISIQERMVARHHVEDRYMVCQTKVSPTMFFDLAKRNESHRYQFVLSVFHWFDLPTRKDFEAALVALFRTAQSTFIELPTIGDRSALIRKQVGWANFERWYDERSNIADIILDAAKAHGFAIRVTKVVSVPWLRWTRDMYRVDWESAAGGAGSGAGQHATSRAGSFTCDARRDTYKCAKREKLQECRDIGAGAAAEHA